MSFAYTTDHKQRLATIQTPPPLAEYIYKLINKKIPKGSWVLDPCVGQGNLIQPWFKEYIPWMVDIDTTQMRLPRPAEWCLTMKPFEMFKWDRFELPSLVLCNPPWSRHHRKANYPEVFLRRIVTLFGPKIPIVFLCPMGMRLNQRFCSKRWRWLRDTMEILSIISVPIDLYPETQFHSEILIFNIKGLRPHYFLPESIIEKIRSSRES